MKLCILVKLMSEASKANIDSDNALTSKIVLARERFLAPVHYIDFYSICWQAHFVIKSNSAEVIMYLKCLIFLISNMILQNALNHLFQMFSISSSLLQIWISLHWFHVKLSTLQAQHSCWSVISKRGLAPKFPVICTDSQTICLCKVHVCVNDLQLIFWLDSFSNTNLILFFYQTIIHLIWNN